MEQLSYPLYTHVPRVNNWQLTLYAVPDAGEDVSSEGGSGGCSPETRFVNFVIVWSSVYMINLTSAEL